VPIVIDVRETARRAARLARHPGRFLGSEAVPADLDPLLSYLLVIALPALLGFAVLEAVVWNSASGAEFLRQALVGVARAGLLYCGWVLSPFVVAAILSCLAAPMGIADAGYRLFAFLCTYAITPAAILSAFLAVPPLAPFAAVAGLAASLYLFFTGMRLRFRLEAARAVILTAVALLGHQIVSRLVAQIL
jgi:hypothetical protein